MWCVSPVWYFRLPSGLVPMIFFDSLVMPQPTRQSMLKTGMRLNKRPDGKP